MKKSPDMPNEGPKLYTVYVSKRFLITSAFISIILSFSAGRTARYIALLVDKNRPGSGLSPDNNIITAESTLPSPKLIDGKIAPHTLYTAKNFDTAASATTSSVHLQQDAKVSTSTSTTSNSNTDTCTNADNDGKECTEPTASANASETEDDSVHLPAGQHLLVDIKNVDATFLNSETRLAHAMVDVVNESKLTLLSYHCHSLIPTGVSCVGVLLESHVSFHTWPEEGVITLDLFTCGSGELVPVLPLITRAFAIPEAVPNDDKQNNYVPEEPVIVWSHKLRGFRPREMKKGNVWANDLGKFIVEATHYDLKEEIASTETDFQRIHVYDTINAKSRDLLSYEKSQSNDGSYQSKYPELFKPNRVVFLDGVLQSTRHGNEAYHEGLVQPAMFAHPDPKRVAIIGGGEGATLREVLKHKSVEKVKMIEIDELMVDFSRKHLPDWNDCSDIIGSAKWCGDDPRAEMRYEDGLAWFNKRFSDQRIDSDEYKEDPFDVLIMDALDPQDDIPFADLLYTNVPFIQALYNSLSDDGILVMQLGEAPDKDGPAETVSRHEKRGVLTQILSKIGFKSIHVYEESHCGFYGPWSFLVGMKAEISRKRWYRSGSNIDIDIHQKIIRSHSGKPNLKYFDGATMTSYQLPSKAFESVYCKAVPTPESCKSDNNQAEEIISQAVRRDRPNKFDIYLDRHVYDKNIGEKNTIMNTLCDYFYYNESRLKFNSAIDIEGIKKECTH